MGLNKYTPYNAYTFMYNGHKYRAIFGRGIVQIVGDTFICAADLVHSSTIDYIYVRPEPNYLDEEACFIVHAFDVAWTNGKLCNI